jgi:predicted MFS family arabinose efflux permease
MRRQGVYVLALFFAFFIVAANLFIIAPLLPFIAQSMPLDKASTTFILSSFAFIAFTVNLLVGPFIDYIGPIRMITIGAAGCAVSFSLSAVSTNAELIILSRVMTGLFMPLVGASVFACLANLVQGKERVKAMGTVSIAAPVAQMIVPSSVIFLGSHQMWRASFAILAALCFLLLITIFLIGKVAPENKVGRLNTLNYRKRMSVILQRKPVVYIGAGYLIMISASLTVQGFYVVWLIKMGVESKSVAILLLGAGIVASVASLRSGEITEYFPKWTSAVVCLICISGTCAILIPFGLTFLIGQFALYAAFAACMSGSVPIIRASANDFVNQDERGTLSGLWNAVYQLGAGLGSAASSLLYSADQSFVSNTFAATFLFVVAAAIFHFKVPASSVGVTNNSASRDAVQRTGNVKT